MPTFIVLFRNEGRQKLKGPLSGVGFGLCKKRSFSSGNFDIYDNTNSISLSSISKLGIKTYVNPAMPEFRDEALTRSLINLFGCGHYETRGSI